jgi:hypothetical protein
MEKQEKIPYAKPEICELSSIRTRQAKGPHNDEAAHLKIMHSEGAPIPPS